VFYEQCKEEWYQGDLVVSFPVIVTDLTANNSSKSLKLFDRLVIVVSQTCDLQRRPFVQVSPVHDFNYLKSELLKDGRTEGSAQSFISSIKNKGVNYYFYLPEDPTRGIKEGYADLNFLSTVSRTQLVRQTRVATISDYQRHVLAYSIGNLFLRPH